MTPLPLFAAFVWLMLATETAAARQAGGPGAAQSSPAANQASQPPLFQGGLGGMLGIPVGDFAEEVTYRLSGNVELDGLQKVSLQAIYAPSEVPVPTPLQMAGWWAEKFSRLYMNSVQVPRLKGVDATLDLLPQRAAVISGIRGLFRSTGGVVGTAIIVLWLELSPDKAAGMRTIFTVLGLLMLATTSLVLLIPDAARERRLAAARASQPDPATARSASLTATVGSAVGAAAEPRR